MDSPAEPSPAEPLSKYVSSGDAGLDAVCQTPEPQINENRASSNRRSRRSRVSMPKQECLATCGPLHLDSSEQESYQLEWAGPIEAGMEDEDNVRGAIEICTQVSNPNV